MSKRDDEEFGVEAPLDIIAAIPPRVLSDELSAPARLILFAVFTANTRDQLTKSYLMRIADIGETSWKKYSCELVHKGWLIRKNHGGAGRGKWRHERVFLRNPRKNPLL